MSAVSTTVKKKCIHPDDKVHTERESCGCMRVKCYTCSRSELFQCAGHGGGRRQEHAGRF